MRSIQSFTCLSLAGFVAVAAGTSATQPASPPAPGTQGSVKPLDHETATLPEDPPIRLKHLFALKREDRRGHHILEFSPDGKILAAGRSAGVVGNPDVLLWDLATRKILHVLPHTQDIEHTIGAIAFVPPGDRLVTGCWSLNRVFVWDVRTGRLLDTMNTGGTASYGVTGLAAFPDGKRVICCVTTGLTVWNLETKTHATLPLEEHVPLARGETRPIERFCFSVRFTANGSRFATTVTDHGLFLPRILLWDANTCRVTRVIPMTRADFPFAYAPDGSTVATQNHDAAVSRKPIVTVWDARTGERLLAGKPFKHDALEITYTRDGKYLVMVGQDGGEYKDPYGRAGGRPALGVWEVATGRLLNRLSPVGDGGIAISPDNKLLAVPAWGPNIDIYAIEYTGK